MTDRRVHTALKCDNGELLEIVRYNRAGKWFCERDGKKLNELSVAAAARIAKHLQKHEGAELLLGVPGGRTFDSIVRKEEGK